ncbi:MAG: phosphohydrolase, partial [Firmicutes bacterium]|nr:phosphohydrolase [Bacillota bacterium]
MLTEIHKKIYELARPFLNTRKNDVHIEISLDYALKLLEAESGDPDVVIPAVILHDLGWWSVPEEMQLKAFGP